MSSMFDPELKMREVAERIKLTRESVGLSPKEMADKIGVSSYEYLAYEGGAKDFSFSFIYKFANACGVEITDLMEGESPHIRSYDITRAGEGLPIARRKGLSYMRLAPKFRNKIAEPFLVTIPYVDEEYRVPHPHTHEGQEMDIVIAGKLKIQVGSHTEVLEAGDTAYYDSGTPHGMIAVGGEDCQFYAIVLNPAGESVFAKKKDADIVIKAKEDKKSRVYKKYIDVEKDENGTPTKITFKNIDNFNFAFDIMDEIAKKDPDKLAMLHVSKDKTERRFTFEDMRKMSNQCANYFKSLGIKKGDRVLLVLKRHYQFWIAMLGLIKLGAIGIPAVAQLQSHDFEYRFQSSGASAVLSTVDGDTAHQIETALKTCPSVTTKIIVNGEREGWHNFDGEFPLYSNEFERTAESTGGDDLMLMYFTSGTSGYPKIATHNCKYPLGHFHTAKYWHCVDPDGLHLTISDTGWAKAAWGKFYGQWMCEAALFVYDFDRFDAADILPMFAKYHITTFCAPPTMLRMMIKQDISHYDFSSVKHMTTAGEALNPEVYRQFEKATGLQILEGFGQTEGTMLIGNMRGAKHRIGSMGKPAPIYDIELIDKDGNPVPTGETGEIVVNVKNGAPCGLFVGYYGDEEKTREVWHDGYYHTGDAAWKDEDGFYWYVGRVDDVIKSSGYRIGPFEIESVIMELPYVLECGVSAAPDEVRGQVVKASIVLVKGTEPTEELKKEIQDYVKKNTAPYKYPRIVVFRDELPKSTSGKIMRNQL